MLFMIIYSSRHHIEIYFNSLIKNVRLVSRHIDEELIFQHRMVICLISKSI